MGKPLQARNESSTSSSSYRYADAHSFYLHLKRLDAGAILHLRQRFWSALAGWGRRAGIAVQDLEEIAQDTIVLLLQKIEDGTYQFQHSDPAAFAAVIARNLLRNFMRKRKLRWAVLGDWDAPADAEIEKYLKNKDLQQQISGFLEKMNEQCRQIIRLRYLEDCTDHEVIRTGITPYGTTDSLRSKRNGCMKKLALLMHRYKHQLLEK